MATNEPDNQKSELDSPNDDVVEAFSEVFGKLMGYATAEWINVDISIAQIKVIFVLHYGGTQTINQLAEKLKIGASTASHLVEKLVRAGLAQRIDSTTDRRIIDVHLTEQGHAMADRLSGVTHKWIISSWVSQLNEDQRSAFGNSLRALLAIIENSPES
ncbi:MAG: MarR family transcriptional regulator [Anaerolineaceae bacterium]|nr:MarR family transcriptional regulator [Anaerolineaceae bacterium]